MTTKDNKEWEYDMCFSYLYEYNPNLQTYTSCGNIMRLFIKDILATQLKKERTDTINEIRKEVERIDSDRTILYPKSLEDIKTFLEKCK